MEECYFSGFSLAQKDWVQIFLRHFAMPQKSYEQRRIQNPVKHGGGVFFGNC